MCISPGDHATIAREVVKSMPNWSRHCTTISAQCGANGENQMATELEEIKLQVAQANRILSDVGLATGVTAALGHASMRLPSQPDRFVVKGRQYALDALAIMRAENMVVCDTEGFLVEGAPGITQCSEVNINS